MNSHPKDLPATGVLLHDVSSLTALRRSKDPHLLNIGFGSSVVADRVVAILAPNSAPIRRLKEDAREEQRLLDATYGRKTRAVIVMDNNHVILSAIQAETLSQRFTLLGDTD